MRPLLSIAILYAVVSLLTLIVYGFDKRQATLGNRRIRERTLHLLELAGGWPGGLLGQTLFRHKRRKFRYMAVFAGIVVLHIAAWTAWIAIRA
ncbi:MAG TPA: DUF1294 domain-containing protein [Humisphaera sp.]|nr:DUF1294 domain-containing protein [Humisphaera sp.]